MKPPLTKYIGCLIGGAIGDSLGARREGSGAIANGGADLAPRYTSDTVMTIAVAESFIAAREFHYWHMSERLIRLYEKEPWRRYGTTTSRVLRSMRHGRQGFGMLDRDLYADGCFGCGAAARVSPVGLLYHDDPRTLRDIAYHCASITHSHDLALEGAVVQACAVALAALADPAAVVPREFLAALRMSTRSEPFQEKLKTILQLLEAPPAREQTIAGLGSGISTLSAVAHAVHAFLTNRGFKNSLLDAVSRGGNAPAIGAMTGAIAGACYGIEGIPSQWRETVENREQLEGLANNLWTMRKTAAGTGAPASSNNAATGQGSARTT